MWGTQRMGGTSEGRVGVGWRGVVGSALALDYFAEVQRWAGFSF